MWNNKHLHLWVLFVCELDSVWQSQENVLRIVVWKNDTFCKQAARNRGFIPGFISILLLKGKIMEGSRMGGLHIIWSVFLGHL